MLYYTSLISHLQKVLKKQRFRFPETLYISRPVWHFICCALFLPQRCRANNKFVVLSIMSLFGAILVICDHVILLPICDLRLLMTSDRRSLRFDAPLLVQQGKENL